MKNSHDSSWHCNALNDSQRMLTDTGSRKRSDYLVTRALVITFFSVCLSTGNARQENKPVNASSGQQPSYVMKKGDAFAYQKVPNGDPTEPEYVWVWYLGKRASSPLIRYQDGTTMATLTCYDDCQFVRWTSKPDGQPIFSGRIRVTNDPLIYSIMRDALSGFLN